MPPTLKKSTARLKHKLKAPLLSSFTPRASNTRKIYASPTLRIFWDRLGFSFLKAILKKFILAKTHSFSFSGLRRVILPLIF